MISPDDDYNLDAEHLAVHLAFHVARYGKGDFCDSADRLAEHFAKHLDDRDAMWLHNMMRVLCKKLYVSSEVRHKLGMCTCGRGDELLSGHQALCARFPG